MPSSSPRHCRATPATVAVAPAVVAARRGLGVRVAALREHAPERRALALGRERVERALALLELQLLLDPDLLAARDVQIGRVRLVVRQLELEMVGPGPEVEVVGEAVEVVGRADVLAVEVNLRLLRRHVRLHDRVASLPGVDVDAARRDVDARAAPRPAPPPGGPVGRPAPVPAPAPVVPAPAQIRAVVAVVAPAGMVAVIVAAAVTVVATAVTGMAAAVGPRSVRGDPDAGRGVVAAGRVGHPASPADRSAPVRAM